MKKHLAGVILIGLLGLWAANSIVFEANSIDQHRHAMVFVEVNDSRIDLSRDRFQLASDAIHLENSNGRIVHAHTKQVTWGQFLTTLKMDYKRLNETELCLRINRTVCGKGTVSLNGEELKRGTVVRQGDILVLSIKDSDPESTVNEYMKEQLPREFKPYSDIGERI